MEESNNLELVEDEDPAPRYSLPNSNSSPHVDSVLKLDLEREVVSLGVTATDEE